MKLLFFILALAFSSGCQLLGVSRAECTDQDPCAEGSQCIEGTCVEDETPTGCQSDHDCDQGQVCDADGTCASAEGTPDTLPPETTLFQTPDALVAQTSATFAFTCNETSARNDEYCELKCRLDENEFETCDSPKTYDALADGEHSFEVKAIDASGNVDPTPAKHTWTVDATAPITTIEEGPPSLSASESANFTFSCDEEGCSFECQLNEEEANA